MIGGRILRAQACVSPRAEYGYTPTKLCHRRPMMEDRGLSRWSWGIGGGEWLIPVASRFSGYLGSGRGLWECREKGCNWLWLCYVELGTVRGKVSTGHIEFPCFRIIRKRIYWNIIFHRLFTIYERKWIIEWVNR